MYLYKVHGYMHQEYARAACHVMHVHDMIGAIDVKP